MEKQTIIANREQRKYVTIAIAWWWLVRVNSLKVRKGKQSLMRGFKKKKKKQRQDEFLKKQKSTQPLKCQKNLVRTFFTFNTYNVEKWKTKMMWLLMCAILVILVGFPDIFLDAF